MLVHTISQSPVLARAAAVAASVAPPVENAARVNVPKRPPPAVPRIEPAEAVQEAVAERAAARVTEHVDPYAQPALIARNYSRRRELGWVLPKPEQPEYRKKDPAMGDVATNDAA